MLEQEIKILLSENEYNLIESLSKNTGSKRVLQTNHYFDTDKFFFFGKDITIRVREKEEDYILTIKVTDLEKSDEKVKVSNEYDYKIDYQTFFRMTHDEHIVLEDYHLEQALESYKEEFLRIKYLGKLVTYRIKFKPEHKLPYVELDKNEYLGNIDWELECEINSIDELKQLEHWLNGISINIVKSKRGKYGRFIYSLKSEDSSALT